MNKKLIALLVIAPLLVSCSGQKKSQFHEEWVKDTNGFDILMGQFAHNIENIWGINEVLIAGPKDYVKYSDGYYTRSHINFDSGSITIETISGTDPMASGTSCRHGRWPARANRATTMLATNRLSTRAVGRIVSGATPTSAIAARYADAPAWPTLA